MKDPRIEKLADLLVNYSLAIKPGEHVLIRGSHLAEPLILEVYKKMLLAGAFPMVFPTLPSLNEAFYQLASKEQLLDVPTPIRLAFETFDKMLSIISDNNTKSLSRVDPQKMVIHSQGQADLMKTMLQRTARGEMSWALTLFPTDAYAQDAEMSLADYEDFVYQACMPDMQDPVGYWHKISAQQDQIIHWLDGKKKVHLVGPDTDLRLSIDGRKFINCDCHVNIPDGEVFTGPVEDSVEGHVFFSYPAIIDGREVTGVRLWFEKGRVVRATAEKNEDYLLKKIDTDAGARYVGEFAIGTNKGITQFTHEILFDEKIGGSFHMALGAGFPETGSKNESAIHWDMICDLRNGGEISVDGDMLYKNGDFVLDL